MSTTITLRGGLRDGEHHDIAILTPTVKAPGAYEDGKRRWDGERFVYSFPTEVYVRSRHDPLVYEYSTTIQAA